VTLAIMAWAPADRLRARLRHHRRAAPILVLIGRLLQGFSAGVELGGVSVYLAEMATPGNKGFYVSWQSASQQVAIIVAAAIGYLLSTSGSRRPDQRLGLAHSLLHRLPDRAGHLHHPPLAAGNRRIPAPQASSELREIFRSIARTGRSWWPA
jgi:MFS family permease